MTIEVRPFVAADTIPTWEVFHAAVHQTAIADYSPEQVAAWAPDSVDVALWRQRRLRSWTFVAVVDGEVVGFSDVTQTGLLDMLFVHPDYGRQGVARVLVTRVIDQARALGLEELHTLASRTARPAFEAFGFVVDRSNDPNWIRGHNLPNYTMHLSL
ncbi:MAG: GNAT family N-acetyltransferase [Propionibacteriaceae bacterium]|jgi:putative acetyltransferase|nr:GNAT family N-acetyltransferase [Propionibacteriaceae bacterium]